MKGDGVIIIRGDVLWAAKCQREAKLHFDEYTHMRDVGGLPFSTVEAQEAAALWYRLARNAIRVETDYSAFPALAQRERAIEDWIKRGETIADRAGIGFRMGQWWADRPWRKPPC